MLRRRVLTTISIAVAGIALGLGATAASSSSVSAYKLPAAGAWTVQDRFEYTAGGRMTVSRDAKRISGLQVTVGARNATSCGSTEAVRLRGSLPIRRLGTSKRPAVGFFSTKTRLIQQRSATFIVNGRAQSGRALVLFDRTGRAALTASVKVGDCNLTFALRKRR
ncbi:MAG: hypothetical protein Q8O56_14265 [Solirubrobacteraceae bacterium]|nr:hypothetical protein [Solirubrobacteraceae bacterium]